MQSPLRWLANGTPVSPLYGEPYFSTEDGLGEARQVFLAGNGLPERFRPGFRIAELGFGTGLNFLAAWMAWEERAIPRPLEVTSFEASPLEPSDMARACARWPELASLAARLFRAWRPVGGVMELGSARLTLILGDARETLPRWQGAADAWFLDGFSPARNPELWEEPLMAEVARHTAPGGSFATYTAAGRVRRALAAQGFAVEKRRGFGRKREMLCGRIVTPVVA
ncbi:MAG TPA: tRNA (5-methylaminomethyl-2-thiouridine)(34)-methyltransferase MnmD [Paracoccaceae bacterium]|nr:tRNA (5-methylaminomethyl-2-thiouridine)(34)-methyltransferase MnmD [Paracoccaceae bacterium]